MAMAKATGDAEEAAGCSMPSLSVGDAALALVMREAVMAEGDRGSAMVDVSNIR